MADKKKIKTRQVVSEDLFRLMQTPSETFVMFPGSFKKGPSCKTQVYEWCSHIKDCEIEDQSRTGRPSASQNGENFDLFSRVYQPFADCLKLENNLRI